MVNILKELEKVITKGQLLQDEWMKNHTTFRIGGPADLLICPETEEELLEGLNICKKNNIPFYVIGNGSNLLVGDNGFRGVIFKICHTLDAVTYETFCEASKEYLRVCTGSGIMLAKLAKDISAKGFTGFEFATGIPGTVGGAVAMNAGAYGGEIVQVLECVRVIDQKGEILEISVEELEMGYRTSRIQKENMILLSAIMKFEQGDVVQIGKKVEDLSSQRKEKQPLEYPSAGSTFKRPEGYFAGKLIQDAGLKGFRVGDAMVSEKHSGFVVNVGNATALDVKQLMEHVDSVVYSMYHVHLEPEVRLIGEF